MTDLDEPDKRVMLFGQDVAQIPCFRNSFLYGISGGIFTGFIAFMRTSRPQFSTHIGFGTFFSGTLAYWFYCRYRYSEKNFYNNQLRAAMQKEAMYEGTEVAKEAILKAQIKEGLKSV